MTRVPCCGLTRRHRRHGPFAPFANRPVSLRIYPDRLVVVRDARLRRDAAEGNTFREQARVIQRSPHLPPKTIHDWRHYLAVVQRKPGALRNSAPFLELPNGFRQVQDHMARAGPAVTARWWISWPSFCEPRRTGRAHRRRACVGRGRADQDPCADHASHRPACGKTAGGPDLDTPEALVLRREPKANVERYDALRPQTTGGRHAS